MSFWEKYFPISYAVGLYGAVALGDWISSSLGTSVGLLETNPLTRDASFHYSLWRSLIVDGFFFAGISLFALAVYWALRFYSAQLAKFAASVAFVYLGVNRLLYAVVPNFILILQRLYR